MLKRVPTLSAILFSGVVLGIMFMGVPVGAQRGAGGTLATQNGDTNGDGNLDIADAVYLLLHLFKGGNPPVALADPPEILARLDSLEARTTALEANAGSLQGDLTALKSEVDSRTSKLAFLLSGSFPFIFKEDCAPGDLPGTIKRPLGIIDVLNVYVAAIRKGEILNDRITFTTDREADLLFEIEGGGGDAGVVLQFDGLGITGIVDTPRLIRSVRAQVQPGEHVITVIPWPGIPCGSIKSSGFSSIIVQYLD
ncbi:MAG: hypothetical protein HY717_01645 [Planctomycetes bacterium]|nr:hypothetical protein [Planctomycetota bacterium]